jgi:hypothetical protein
MKPITASSDSKRESVNKSSILVDGGQTRTSGAPPTIPNWETEGFWTGGDKADLSYCSRLILGVTDEEENRPTSSAEPMILIFKFFSNSPEDLQLIWVLFTRMMPIYFCAFM